MGLIAIMCVQHMLITNPERPREEMYKSWSIYRFNIMLTYLIVILLLTMDLFAVTISGDKQIVDGITNLLNFQSQSTFVAIITAFFFAAAVLIAEDLLEKKVMGPFARLRDSWLIWFVSLAISVALLETWLQDVSFSGTKAIDTPGEHATEPSTPVASGGSDKFLATSILLFGTVTYAMWIYNVLHRQITKGDGFRGRVLGYILNPGVRAVPVQAMVIGPKRSGKTELVKQCDLNFRDMINSRGQTRTQVKQIEEGRFNQEMKVREPKKVLGVTTDSGTRHQWVTMVDAPGENLGDHVALPYEIRTDVLVMVIRANALNDSEDVIKEVSNWGLDSFHRCCAPYPSDARTAVIQERLVSDAKLDGYHTGNYIKALGLAINRAESHLPPEGRYTIGAFVLVLNADLLSSERKKLAWVGNDHLQLLAKEIGERFGVDARYCHGHLGSVQVHSRSIFIDAVQRLLYPDITRQNPGEPAVTSESSLVLGNAASGPE